MLSPETIQKNSDSLLQQLPQLSVLELERLVQHHNMAYFEKNAPEITDETFDKLLETLRRRAPQASLLEELGSDITSGGDNIKHPRPMLSLDKCYDEETLHKWCEKIRGNFVAMPKIDGVACSLQYDIKGKLILGATRGDGFKGENVTENIRRIGDIPGQIDPTSFISLLYPKEKTLEIRGEVHLKLSRFNQYYADSFANPRNLAAGALKQKEANKSENYGLSFFPYDVRGTQLPTEEAKFALINQLGFFAPPLQICAQFSDIVSAYKNLAYQRDSLDYEVDGLVIRANWLSEQERLGETAHHPRFAIAYKFQGDSAQTELAGVEWSVGRTGIVTPVAVVKPVFVSGATVTRASMHNLGMLRKLHIHQYSLVEIVRRGGVIPHVERVLSSEGPPIPSPAHCPSCNSLLREEGDFLHCTQPEKCTSILTSRLQHFCMVVEIQGLGEKHLTHMVQRKLVKEPADLYSLGLEDFLSLDRMGGKLARKLQEEIQNKNKMPLSLFLTALGIGEIGPTVAETLTQHFPTLEQLQQASKEELSSVHGIGPSIATSLSEGLQKYHEEIEHLLKVITLVLPEKKVLNTEHPLFQKGVVFTGKMAHLDRKEAQKKVREAGGHTPSSVTLTTDLLVVGDDGSPLLGAHQKSTKQKEAEKLQQQGSNIRIITESEFLQLF